MGVVVAGLGGPILWRGWRGWRDGAVNEVRAALVALVALFFGLSLLHPLTVKVLGLGWLGPRAAMAMVFAGVVLLTGGLTALAVGWRSKVVYPYALNSLDRGLGVAVGAFAGSLIAGAIGFWLALAFPIGLAEGAVPRVPEVVRQWPVSLYRGFERGVLGIGPRSAERARFPVVELREEPVTAEVVGAGPGTSSVLVILRPAVGWE